MRRKPYAVILFEKAHQDVFNPLLQVLDDGWTIGSQGQMRIGTEPESCSRTFFQEPKRIH